jgi:intracellular sulfur oxidation DsrE/DsrF family protein
MKIIEDLNDQVLGSFVDGQLDAEISELIINEMDNNADVRERVYKLRRTKDLLRLAFSTHCAQLNPFSKTTASRWKRYTMAMAASLIAIAISFGSGAGGYLFAKHKHAEFAQIDASVIQQKTDRILLHVSESSVEQFAVALDYAEKFLQEHEAKGGQIAVVANAGGLDLMRVGISPFEQKVRYMMKKYSNMYFIACANSVRALEEEGVQVKLINNISVEKPALDHIIDYVQKGWTYKKVKTLVKA